MLLGLENCILSNIDVVQVFMVHIFLNQFNIFFENKFYFMFKYSMS